MLQALRRAAVVIPLAWTGAWLGYYAYTDTIRRANIRSRNRELEKALADIPGAGVSPIASEEEKEALKRRFASFKRAGRYWNLFPEWREQGAWEWAWWKLILSTINGKLFFFDGWGSPLTAADGSDLPKETPIPDLPVEEPDFATLFGKNAPPAPTNGAGVRTTLGGADIDVTDKLTMTWMGQSTNFVTLDKLAILTDPALQHRTIPSSLAPERLRPPPCNYEDLKRVDLVLVSHNHYDHLDPEAVREYGDSCEWVVPAGAGNYLRQLGVTRVTELDWWQEKKHKLQRPGQKDKTYTITCVPVMHWSARSPADTNATLWAGFHVKSDDNKRSFIHMGDTGYSETLFAAVGRVLGPIDLAAIPIGSYEPRWHMHLQHTDPEGAVRMALNMGCKKSVGVHWGTWIMSDEAYNMPPIDLDIARKKLGVSEEAFCTLPVGRTVVVD